MLRRLLILLFCLFPFSTQASQDLSAFYSQLGKWVDQATHKREGVVIWTSLEDHEQKIFGNRKWASKEFLPGSVFKLLIAQAAVDHELSFHYQCTGRDEIEGKKRHCWTYKGHGSLDLPGALAISCNLYFENLGVSLGWDKIITVMKQYSSLKSQPLESASMDLARFSIGDEGRFHLNPLQVDQFWNQYVQKIQDPLYSSIFQGLRRSAASGGTASKLKKVPLEILAKTGTGDAQNPNYKTNAWFLGAYPAQSPRYTILILLQEAHGFEEASRLAEKVFSKLAEFEVRGREE